VIGIRGKIIINLNNNMDKLLIIGSNLNVKRDRFHNAPSDRQESIEITGQMRSPSDGYHTFDELYDHRITLFIALCRFVDNRVFIGGEVWRSK